MGEFPRLAVIGAGSLSTNRIYPYLGAARAELVGVCDLDADKARRNATLFGGRPYSDWKQMLDVERPDAVIVCIGPDAHPVLAKAILERGLPVYTEKPPAATAAAAKEVADTADRTGLLCVTAFKKRYTAAANRAKQFLDDFPETDRLSFSVDYAGGVHRNDSPRTMLLLDFGVHIFDLSAWLWGLPTEVFAFSRGYDAYAVSMKYANGSVATVNLVDDRDFRLPTEEIELTLKGGNFMTIHNSSCWRITRDRQPCEWREPPTFTSSGDSGRDTGHLAELEDFVQAVKEGRTTSRSSIQSSYGTMVLLEAVQQAADSGQPVTPCYQR